MGWVYKVSSRSFYLNGTYQFSTRYSGRPGYKDNSANECVKGNGPLPRGKYTIGAPFAHPKTRAWTMRLTPNASNNMCGRDGFMIHGDSSRHPGEASDGCIIVDLSGRKAIAASGDTSLTVEE
ncbi:tlde1 domain-containing protein [Gibbsiella quercinecans]|uniref:tlde1 domain-containing protein n=1 Tax=Gibbsiella quercinecans TaxID=929813 RepID=UPI003A4E0F46